MIHPLDITRTSRDVQRAPGRSARCPSCLRGKRIFRRAGRFCSARRSQAFLLGNNRGRERKSQEATCPPMGQPRASPCATPAACSAAEFHSPVLRRGDPAPHRGDRRPSRRRTTDAWAISTCRGTHLYDYIQYFAFRFH